jgi:predicted helicase
MPGGRNRSVGYVFDLSSTGIMSGRDDWVYDFSDETERDKLHAFRTIFQSVKRNTDPKSLPLTIKWSRNLKRKIGRVPPSELVSIKTEAAQLRPFVVKRLPKARYLIDELGAINQAFAKPNRAITFLSVASSHPIATLIVNRPFDYGLLKTGNGGTQGLYRYRYTSSGERVDNITDWALKQFQTCYGSKAGVTKDAIFAYCYAVLHDPAYREKYALNLKREFPRIPFYDDFAKWAGWGQQLLDLHIGYETAKPFKFIRIDTPNPKRAKGSHPKAKLKSDPEKGLIIVDEDTQLTGIPRESWDYRLGNRSGIDWVLDQHKEKTPRDPTVRARFNAYRFADYKESMIDLLARVITVSLETVKITEAMRSVERKSDA